MLKQITAVLFSLLILMGCNDSNIKRNKEIEKDIHSAVSMISDNSDSELGISEFAKFEWDKAFLIHPYTPQTAIEKQLGVKFKDPSNIDSRDDIYLLIFLHQNKVVQYVEIERLDSSFSLGDKEHLEPSDDVIYIER